MPKQIPATKLTDVGTTALEGLGEVRFGPNDGKAYRYCLIKGKNGVKGDVCGFFTSDNYQVAPSTHTADPEDRPAGILLANAPSGNYAWLQCLGYNTYAITNGGVTANARLYKNSLGIGMLTTGADGVRAVGTAVKADSGSFLTSLFLDCL